MPIASQYVNQINQIFKPFINKLKFAKGVGTEAQVIRQNIFFKVFKTKLTYELFNRFNSN